MTAMPSDDILSTLIPGMPEAVDTWTAAYYDLFVNRGPATTPGERHARHLEEAGLLGRAFTIMQLIQEARRDSRPAVPSFTRQPIERDPLTATGPYDPFRPVAASGTGDNNGAAHP